MTSSKLPQGVFLRRRTEFRAFAVVFAICVPLAELSRADASDLVLVDRGKTNAVIVVSPEAGLPESKLPDGSNARGRDPKGQRNHEWLAAEDLAIYIARMTGAQPKILASREEIEAALAGTAPVILVGEEALKARPDLAERIRAAAKPNPILMADAIGLLRDGNRIYVAGNNDLAHYFAAAELLWRWGCRWYMPTDFGECVPEVETLTVGDLNYVYGSPFEIRTYWISWLGDPSGQAEFQRRNMMTGRDPRGFPPTGHALNAYTHDLPGSKGPFNFPITAPETALHIAEKIAPKFAQGEGISLGIEDGYYVSDYPKDMELLKLQWDKYFLQWSVTDAMMELYNNVARILQERYPDSNGRIGFLAYANMTLPPVRPIKAERSLFCELAPIDIDPIHGMDDEDSPPRREYRDMMYRWAEVMSGRLVIYDYDQSMLVWRDIPNPSHQSFRQDIRHYARASILGVKTESRNAIATTFLNLFLRGRLMWNPQEDVNALLREFYPKFYGPAAEPMERYWNTIYAAWEDTIVTEHEYFIVPAIYTPEVVEQCREALGQAEQLLAPLAKKPKRTRNEQQFLDRIRFTRLSFEILDSYTSMVREAATNGNYKEAVTYGERALAMREILTDMNGIFTTYRRIGERGPAWLPGEVEQYRLLAQLTDGSKGRLVQKLPLEWAFRRDKARKGLERNYAAGEIDLTFWNKNRHRLTPRNRKDYPDEWEMIRTDLYAQAQGIRDPDGQSFTGDMWYRTEIELSGEQIKNRIHIRFPGLFNECWLYVNGQQVAHRTQKPLWWENDYSFEWDVDLTGVLREGKNTLALQCRCEHHYGGIFRRPFLYTPVSD